MKQYLSFEQLQLIEDYRLILAECEVLENEISNIKSFLVKFGLAENTDKILVKVNEFNRPKIYDRVEATVYYLFLKIALIDFQLIVNDNQLNEIFEVCIDNQKLFEQFIHGIQITPETRPGIIQNLNLYISFKPERQPAGFSIFTKSSKN